MQGLLSRLGFKMPFLQLVVIVPFSDIQQPKATEQHFAPFKPPTTTILPTFQRINVILQAGAGAGAGGGGRGAGGQGRGQGRGAGRGRGRVGQGQGQGRGRGRGRGRGAGAAGAGAGQGQGQQGQGQGQEQGQGRAEKSFFLNLGTWLYRRRYPNPQQFKAASTSSLRRCRLVHQWMCTDKLAKRNQGETERQGDNIESISLNNCRKRQLASNRC